LLLFFKFSFEYPNNTIRENQVRLQFNGIYHVLFYVYIITLFGGNINAIKKITEAVFDTSKETGLEIPIYPWFYSPLLNLGGFFSLLIFLHSQ
jgi:hypothetical protein